MAGSIKKSAMVMDLEATNGTPVAPTAGSNAVAIRAKNLKFKTDVVMATRDVITGALGNEDKLPFSHTFGGTFGVELAGAGAAGNTPAWGKTMQMGGFAETVIAGSRVEYTPLKTGFRSATIFAQNMGRLEKYFFIMAALKLSFVVGEVPGLEAACKGLVTSIAAGDLGAAPTLTAWARSLAVGSINTSAMSLGAVTYAAGVLAGGTAYNFKSCDIDFGTDVQLLELASIQKIDIYDFKPKIELVIDLTPAQHAQFVADMKAGNTTGLGFRHGAAAGKGVMVHCPRCVIADMDDQSIGPVYVSKITLEPRDSVDGAGDWMRLVAL